MKITNVIIKLTFLKITVIKETVEKLIKQRLPNVIIYT